MKLVVDDLPRGVRRFSGGIASPEHILAIVFAGALFLHIALVAPLVVHSGNSSIFSVGPFAAGRTLVPIGAGISLGFLLGHFFRNALVGFVLMIACAWTGVFVVAGFQFGLFIDGKVLDGSPVIWDLRSGIIEATIFLAGLCICLQLRRTPRSVLFAVTTLFVVMNFVAFAPAGLRSLNRSTVVTESVLNPDKFFFATRPVALPAMDSYSRDRNVIVFLVDTLQNDIAEKLFRSPLANDYQGFTFYTNAAGSYPYTTLTIPLIFAGIDYQPGELVHEYLTKSNDLRMDHLLAAKGWETSYLSLLDRGVYVFKAYEAVRNATLLANATLYRLLPTALKMSYFGDNHDFTGATNDADNKDPHVKLGFSSNTDVAILKKMTAEVSPDAERSQFKWIHLWGAHFPSRLDADCRPASPNVNEADFAAQATCILSLIGDYLVELQRNGVYDNSQIYILGDHGTLQLPIEGRPWTFENFIQASAHPAILFKDFEATGPLRFWDAPVSLKDVRATVLSEDSHNLKNATHENSSPRLFQYYPSAAMTARPIIPSLDRYEIGSNIRNPDDWRLLESFRQE